MVLQTKGESERRRAFLHQSAVVELRHLALALHRRQKDPCDIFCALFERSALLAEAHSISPIPTEQFVRELPGLAGWDAERAIGEFVAAALAERRRRSLIVAEWLKKHAESAAAAAAVRAVQTECVARIEEAKCRN